ncbi:MAG: YsnF/AvaK domain-containing protein [Deltaproteobacteria bacterium]|nr:YsnF/AvaK domain-containing protein [Deltaproteobacteria bacterium]
MQTGDIHSTAAGKGNFTESDFERISGFKAYDRADRDIGTVKALWTDPSGEPAYIGVQTTWLIGRTHVVPAFDCEVNMVAETVRVPYTQDDVEGAPSFDPDLEITPAVEREVKEYYRMRGGRIPEQERAMQPPENARAGSRATAAEGDVTIPLHEEKLDIGKESVEVGGVRLKKIVRTEQVERPLELKREDVVIERVPAGGEAAQDAFHRENIYIPLRAEVPVVSKEARVKEEVRARKTKKTKKEVVSDKVRREDIDIEEEGRPPYH